MSNLYDNIQFLCKLKGLTIGDLERESHLAEKSIRRWNTSSPSIDKVFSVSQTLHVPIETLYPYRLDQNKYYAADYMLDNLITGSSSDKVKWENLEKKNKVHEDLYDKFEHDANLLEYAWSVTSHDEDDDYEAYYDFSACVDQIFRTSHNGGFIYVVYQDETDYDNSNTVSYLEKYVFINIGDGILRTVQPSQKDKIDKLYKIVYKKLISIPEQKKIDDFMLSFKL